MLAVGRKAVAQTGFTLSLEHLRMEDLIRDSGVSRTSSYRKWPTKDAYAADLLIDIAQATDLLDDGRCLLPALQTALPEATSSLSTPEGRHEALVELLRVSLAADFNATSASRDWSVFLSLRAGYRDLPEGPARDAIGAALRETSRRFTTIRGRSLRQFTEILGYRLRTDVYVDWADLSNVIGDLWTGLTIRSYVDGDDLVAPVQASVSGTTERTWTRASLTVARMFLAAVEPDPTVVWDEQRIVSLQQSASHPEQALAEFMAAIASL